MSKLAKKRATIDDVAQLAGVSIKTVSRVLNDEAGVRGITRDKVTAAVRSLNYAPNISARRLAASRSFIVALLYQDDDVNHYIPDVQHGILEVCRARRYHLLLHPCQGGLRDAAREIHDLAKQSVLDGIIVTPPLSDSRQLMQELAQVSVPFVRVSQLYRGELSPSVSVGDRSGASAMVSYLADLGHRDIAFIVGNADQGASIERLRGFREAAAERRLTVRPECIRQGDFTFEAGIRCMHEILALEPRPSAVFASNDDMAAGALLVAHRGGIAVPGELSIVGFDDIAMSQRLWPPLTTIRQPTKKAAAAATRMLLGCLDSRDFTPVNEELPGELVIRESAGPCP